MENIYQEKGIKIFDLFLYILEKWKTVVIFSMVFAVIFGALYFLQEMNRDSIGIKLTEEEKSNVQLIAKTIESQQQALETQKMYNKESIYQNLNAFDIKVVELSYYVDNHYVLEYPMLEKPNNLIAIIQTYCSVLSNTELYEAMSKEFGTDVVPEFYAELVFIDEEYADNGYFSVLIYGDDDALVENMALFIDDNIKGKSSDIENLYGKHDLSLVEKNKREVKDSKVYDTQQENISRLSSLSTNIKNLQASLSRNEQVYLKQIQNDGKQIDDTPYSKSITGVVKNMLVGFLIGFILGVGIVFIRYMMGQKLHYAKESSEIYNLQYIGELRFDDGLTKYKQRIKTLRNPDSDKLSLSESIDFICAKIDLLSNKKNVNSICIITETLFETAQEQLDKIKDRLSDKSEVKILKHVILRPNYVEELSKSDAVVFVHQVGKTKYSDVEKEITLCEECGIEVLGVIVIN